MKCDVCKRELNSIAVQVYPGNLTPSEAEFAFCPYEPRTYNICFGCFLKSLGVPLEGNAIYQGCDPTESCGSSIH